MPLPGSWRFFRTGKCAAAAFEKGFAMPNLTDAELGRALRQNELSPVYFLYGREAFLSEGYLRKIQEKAVRKGTESFNLQRFDGGELDMVSLQVAEEGMPMMAERKCVTLMNPNLEKMRKEDFDALLEIVKDPNPACVFIIYVNAFDLNVKKMARVRKLAEAVAKTGTVVEFSQRTQGDLAKFLKTRFQKAGLAIDGPVAAAMIARCGSTLEILSGEADKLIAYKGGEGTVTREDVELVTRKSLEASVFDLSKLMLQNQYTRAFTVLEELFQLREEPLAILGALSSAFVDLYRAKTAMLSSRTAEDVLALFPGYRGKEFRVRNAFRDVSKYSVVTLRRCLEVLSDTEVRLKSSRCDDRAALEQAVASILSLSVSDGGRLPG